MQSEKDIHSNAAIKTLQVQRQVRQNAEAYRNTLNDLYSWQQDIKDREDNTNKEYNTPKSPEKLPPRNFCQEETRNKAATATKTRTDGGGDDSSMEGSVQKPTNITGDDPLARKHNEANEHKDRGNNYVKLEKYNLAINEYTSAINIYPEDAVYYTNRALCYLKREMYDECIEDCGHAIDLNSKAVKAYYRRMLANESLGNHVDALKDCTVVLMIEPKNAEARKSLARINARLKINAPNEPNFIPLGSDMVDLLPIVKPPCKRSKAPLHRVRVIDTVGPKDFKNQENRSLQISDEDIDKLFNSNVGEFVEIKKKPETATASSASTTISAIKRKPVATSDKADQQPITAKSPAKERNQTISAAAAVQKDSQQIEFENIFKEISTPDAATSKLDRNETKPVTPKVEHNGIQTSSANANVVRSLPPPPIFSTQFYSNWKDLTYYEKYQYFKSIEIPLITKVLGAGFDHETLTDILHIIRDYYVPSGHPSIAATLLEVSKHSQIGIFSVFLSNEDRQCLKDIIQFIENDDFAEVIAKNFELI